MRRSARRRVPAGRAFGWIPAGVVRVDDRVYQHREAGRNAHRSGGVEVARGGLGAALEDQPRCERGDDQRHRHIDPQTARTVFLRVKAPNRSLLAVVQVEALLDAARLLDGEHREFSWRELCAIRADSRPATQVARDFGVSDTLIRRIRRNEIWKEPGRRHVARLPLAGTLVLSGPRITELCRLDSPDDIDLAARAVRIPRVKTDAAERVVPMVPTLHEILLGDRIERGVPNAAPAFPTRQWNTPGPRQCALAAPTPSPATGERTA
jgi:hypothetical protein